MELSEQLIQKIKEEGPISFREFMERSLYATGQGYYASSQDPVGTDGDYYTCASLTPAFGATIAKQLEEMWRCLGRRAFTIVEYGAGDGTLCRDILSALSDNKEMYECLRYCIIEKRKPCNEALPDDKVSWHQSIKEITAIRGCILSNELLDNFPVHRVWMEAALMELFIDFRDGFIETWRPAAQELRDYFTELGVALPRGFRTEINLQAVRWVAEAANAIDRGYVLTIDYGYPSKELYKPCRNQGTVLGYYHHAVTDNLYDHIGRQDITAHVNFSALSHWGAKSGLNVCGFTDQCHFLLSLGLPEVMEKMVSDENDVIGAARKVSALRYILLADMGIKCKVLIQEKGGCSRALSGLRILPPVGEL